MKTLQSRDIAEHAAICVAAQQVLVQRFQRRIGGRRVQVWVDDRGAFNWASDRDSVAFYRAQGYTPVEVSASEAIKLCGVSRLVRLENVAKVGVRLKYQPGASCDQFLPVAPDDALKEEIEPVFVKLHAGMVSAK